MFLHYTLKPVFCDLHRETSPLSVSKNISDCMRSHNDSIDTTHTPPPLSFYNTFKMIKISKPIYFI
jgi:hypothetical protein